MTFLEVPTLENDFVRLEALDVRHSDQLAAAVAVDDLWRAWYTHVPRPEDVPTEIASRLARHAAGEIVPWAIIDRSSGRAVGMTSYLNVHPEHRRLEIGSTWISRSAQGTKVNPAAKLLLLRRAFDDLGCIAVEFRTHWHNRQSRSAIAKLGAKQDGVLRNHQIFENGTVRDTVVFSIIDAEWPTVEFGLKVRLDV